MQAPREVHMEAAKRMLRYLKGNPGQGILLRHDCDFTLTAFCDSNWGGHVLLPEGLFLVIL